MRVTRRDFLKGAAAGCAGLVLAQRLAEAAEDCRYKLSACDWSLHERGKVEGLATAKRVGLDGLEVSAGEPGPHMALADPAFRAKYKEQREATGIVISSTAMGLLNQAPFARDERAVTWVEETIAATADLNAKVCLLAFFGMGDLRSPLLKKPMPKLVDATVERLKTVAPKAEQAGVVLGLENTLSAKDNMAILERVQSNAVQIYYDIANSTFNGYDVPAEIREYGAHMCQFHFKDKGYLGDKVAVEAAAEAIKALDYSGWIVLETPCPSKDRDADFIKNVAITKRVMDMA